MSSWYFTCVELCSLPDLCSPSHWHWVLEQVVYSNKGYLKDLDFSAIHLSCLSGLIVNVHPPINPGWGACPVCRVLLSLCGRKCWLALPPSPSRQAAGSCTHSCASHTSQALVCPERWLWQSQDRFSKHQSVFIHQSTTNCTRLSSPASALKNLSSLCEDGKALQRSLGGTKRVVATCKNNIPFLC